MTFQQSKIDALITTITFHLAEVSTAKTHVGSLLPSDSFKLIG